MDPGAYRTPLAVAPAPALLVNARRRSRRRRLAFSVSD
jgi:hypothetical protein